MKPLALLINKFVPPDESPTARLLGDVADCLSQAGWDVEFAGRKSGYRTQRRSLLHRGITEVLFHLKIVLRSVSGRKPSLLVSLTSPPGLVVTVSILSRFSGAKHIHWCMDLYPDVAVALGAIKPNSWINRMWTRLSNRAYSTCSRIVALDEDMKENFEGKGFIAEIQSPWPPDFAQFTKAALATPNSVNDEQPFWLYSGNLGRVHEWKTLLEAQSLLEKRTSPIRLVFQGSGPEMSAAMEAGTKLALKQVDWLDYAPQDRLIGQLVSAQALIVTQRPETKGMLYPSKLSVIESTKTPVVWVGDEECYIARSLSNRSNCCIATPGDAKTIADFIESQKVTHTDIRANIEDFQGEIERQRDSGHQFWTKLAENEIAIHRS